MEKFLLKFLFAFFQEVNVPQDPYFMEPDTLNMVLN